VSKNVAVFVDVANIFYAAKAAGVDIDYVTLLKSAGAGRDLVRAYAYTGLDPDNENQRNFHSFLARHGYRVVSKDIRKYGDGKVKANLDIELVVDMMKTARNLDIAIVVSGDGDFAPAIRAVQEMGVRVEVISFRGNTSSDLIEVADQFTDITALAKVEKGSSRSGRRVAEADEDLSMTEVPDKQTEGVGGRSGRGGRGRTGRGRGREGLVAARASRPIGQPAAVTSSGAPLVVLPGEKLSRVASAGAGLATGVDGQFEDMEERLDDPASGGAIAVFTGGLSSGPVGSEGDTDAPAGGQGDAEGEEGDAEARRRRRRRGGRGRGRGRGREGAGESLDTPVPLRAASLVEESYAEPEEPEEPEEAPRGPRPTPFGSVWDSQLGVPAMAAPSGRAPIVEDEDFDEPEIPEYLIAERRNRGGQGPGQLQRGGRGGPRGGRSAYAAAMDRERYGRGGGGGGINRYPDVSARERQPEPRREERFVRPSGGGAAPAGRRSGGDEPWSEVPPELEAMLRAQLGNRPAERRPERPAFDGGGPAAPEIQAPAPDQAEPDVDATPPMAEAAPVAARRGRRTAAPAEDAAAPQSGDGETPPTGADPEVAPKRRTTRRSTATADAGPPADAEAAPAPKRRAPRRVSAADASVESTSPDPTGSADPSPAVPRRRVTRRTTPAAIGSDEAVPEALTEEAPRRRAARRKVGEETPGG